MNQTNKIKVFYPKYDFFQLYTALNPIYCTKTNDIGTSMPKRQKLNAKKYIHNRAF